MMLTAPLTPAQRRYLVEIREAGTKVYNGRAQRPLEALRDAGLIALDVDIRGGPGGSYAFRLTATAVVVDANGDPVPGDVPPSMAAFFAHRIPAARCPHYIATIEADAGFTRCERCSP